MLWTVYIGFWVVGRGAGVGNNLILVLGTVVGDV